MSSPPRLLARFISDSHASLSESALLTILSISSLRTLFESPSLHSTTMSRSRSFSSFDGDVEVRSRSQGLKYDILISVLFGFFFGYVPGLHELAYERLIASHLLDLFAAYHVGAAVANLCEICRPAE